MTEFDVPGPLRTLRTSHVTVPVPDAGSGINIGIGDWENDGTDNGGDAE